MANVKVVTDSGAYINPEIAKDLDVEILPLRVRVGDEIFREGVDIESSQLLHKLSTNSVLPVLEPPSVEEIGRIYRKLSHQTDEILSIHVSRRLCDVVRVAQQASQPFLGRSRITILDSMVISLGQGLLVEEAVRASNAGLSMTQIIRLVRGMIPRIYAIFFTDNLKYLEQGGRIGQAQTILGTMLGIKPILTLEDGDILPLEKVRTQEKALDKLIEFVTEFSAIEQVAILQNGFPETTAALLELLDVVLPGRDIPVLTYGPSLAVQVGPNAMGILVFEKD
jgi:DegV family protein with EDD domain